MLRVRQYVTSGFGKGADDRGNALMLADIT
jgi:hypothetical protein